MKQSNTAALGDRPRWRGNRASFKYESGKRPPKQKKHGPSTQRVLIARGPVVPLRVRVALRALDRAGNAVADVAPLAGLAAVKALDLRGNPVADFSPLVVLPVLARLDADGEAAGTDRAGVRSRALARSPRDTHDGNGSPEGSR